MVSSLLCIFSCATGCYDQKPELLCKYNVNGWYPPPTPLPISPPILPKLPPATFACMIKTEVCMCNIYPDSASGKWG